MKALVKKVIPEFLKSEYRILKKKKLLQRYSGDKVFCLICKSSFREFMPFGLVTRKNACCPNCESLERHRLLFKYLTDKTNIFSKNRGQLRVLHFAPEKAFYDLFSADKTIDYVPTDICPDFYNYNGPVAIKEMDITKIPYQDNYFDVVLCSHVLEHISDDRLAMSEIFRVMKKGGWSILQVPIDYNRETTYEDFSITEPEARLAAFGQKDHVRWYGRDYKERLASVGFNVNEDAYVKSFSPEEIFHYGFMQTELVYYCTK